LCHRTNHMYFYLKASVVIVPNALGNYSGAASSEWEIFNVNKSLVLLQELVHKDHEAVRYDHRG